MTSGDLHADFLDRVYDAAIEPQLWTDVLERFADLLGGTEANLVADDEIACEGKGFSVRSDPAALPLYLQHYIKCSPLLKTNDLPLAPCVLTDEAKIPKRELMKTEFYNDFLRPFEAHSLLIVRLAVEFPRTALINVIRPARHEPFGSQELETARRLHPHLIRAFRLGMRLAGNRLWQDGATMLADDSSLAVFLLDSNDIVRHVNRAGENLLASSSAITVRKGSLRAATAEATRRLQTLIAAARASDPERRSAGTMSLSREPHRALSLSVVPVRATRPVFPGAGLLSSDSSILVCVSCPQDKAQVSELRLRELFDLTPAEARVLSHLLAGRSPREAARQLGVSFYTVRGHLARIFDKTGVNRQSELVRTVMLAIGQLPNLA